MNASYDTVVVLNSGGRGSRLQNMPDLGVPNSQEYGISKALVTVGQPRISLIEHQINFFLDQQVSHVVVDAGDHINVKDYVAKRYDADLVTTVTHHKQSGTAGDLIKTMGLLQDQLFGKFVLVHNVDTILDINVAELVKTHKSLGGTATIALTTLKNVPNEGAFLVDGQGAVVHSDESGDQVDNTRLFLADWRGSSTGMVILNPDFTDLDGSWPEAQNLSLYSHVLGSLVTKSLLRAYNNNDKFFMDVGTVPTLLSARGEQNVVQDYLCYSPS